MRDQDRLRWQMSPSLRRIADRLDAAEAMAASLERLLLGGYDSSDEAAAAFALRDWKSKSRESENEILSDAGRG
jgi:hypothetical protein